MRSTSRVLAVMAAVTLMGLSPTASGAAEPLRQPVRSLTGMLAAAETDGPAGLAYDERYVVVQRSVGVLRIVDTRSRSVTADVPTPEGRSCRPVAMRRLEALVRCAPPGSTATDQVEDEFFVLDLVQRRLAPLAGSPGGRVGFTAIGRRWIEGVDGEAVVYFDRVTGELRQVGTRDDFGSPRDLDDPALPVQRLRPEKLGLARCRDRRLECLTLYRRGRGEVRLGRVRGRGYGSYQPGRFVTWWNGPVAMAWDRRRDRFYAWRFTGAAPPGVLVDHTLYGALFVRVAPGLYPQPATLLFSPWRKT